MGDVLAVVVVVVELVLMVNPTRYKRNAHPTFNAQFAYVRAYLSKGVTLNQRVFITYYSLRGNGGVKVVQIRKGNVLSGSSRVRLSKVAR